MRTIVIGRNSRLWSELRDLPLVAASSVVAISHHDVGGFAFAPGDCAWVFSYSRRPAENEALLRRLREAGVRDVVYISTATVNVVPMTGCYEYPRVKWQAEEAALRLCRAQILRIGVVYGRESQLPGGRTAATSITELAAFLVKQRPTDAPTGVIGLFQIVERPFGSAIERWCFCAYGFTMRACRPFPCVLRPVDAILRAAGWRWYGYLYMSNRLWSTTI